MFTRLSYYAQSNIQAVWYSGLALALASIATSTQLAVALSRLGSHPDGLSNIREVLGTQGEDDVWRPSRLQLIIWQAPISLLNASVIFYIVGLVFVVASSVSPSSVKHDIKVWRDVSFPEKVLSLSVQLDCCAIHLDSSICYRTIFSLSLRPLSSSQREERSTATTICNSAKFIGPSKWDCLGEEQIMWQSEGVVRSRLIY